MGGFETTVATLCMEQLVLIQTVIYHGEMKNQDSVFDIYKRGGAVLNRFNSRLLNFKQTDSLQKVYIKFGSRSDQIYQGNL